MPSQDHRKATSTNFNAQRCQYAGQTHKKQGLQRGLRPNLQCSVDASLKYRKRQQPGVMLSNQAQGLDGLGTSGGNLLGAVGSTD